MRRVTVDKKRPAFLIVSSGSINPHKMGQSAPQPVPIFDEFGNLLMYALPFFSASASSSSRSSMITVPITINR